MTGTARSGRSSRLGATEEIAGAMVTDGKATRGSSVRVMRDGAVVFDGRIESLRRFKEDTREVASGYEFGLRLDGFNSFQEGDVLEFYRIGEG